jgi:hypothetical protein
VTETKGAKSKARSPQYPVVGLGDAIAKVRSIYEKDYQNRIPKSVVAKHIGFNALHGKSLGVIAALTRYGLLEGRGDDCRVSDRAVTIIAHPAGSADRVAAIQAAANAPEIFQEIDGKFPEGRGSDEGIRAYLLTNKFIPGAADTVIHSYRDTKRAVAAELRGYDSGSDAEVFEAATEKIIRRGAAAGAAQREAIPIRNRPPPPPRREGIVLMEGERELTTGLLAKDASFRLIVTGKVGVKEIERLIRKLELDKEILADEAALDEDADRRIYEGSNEP